MWNSSPYMLAKSMEGISGFTGNDPLVRTVLNFYANEIRNFPVVFPSESIGLCCKSLQRIKTAPKEVIAIIKNLNEHHIEKLDRLECLQDFGNCMLGLFCMSSKTPEVIHFLENLTLLLNRPTSDHQYQEPLLFDVDSLGDTLLGLRCLVYEDNAVVIGNLLSAINDKLRQSEVGIVDLRNIGSLYGLRNMSDSIPQVVDLLESFHSKIRENKDLYSTAGKAPLFDMRNLMHLLTGLQNCNLSLLESGQNWKEIFRLYFFITATFMLREGEKLDEGDKDKTKKIMNRLPPTAEKKMFLDLTGLLQSLCIVDKSELPLYSYFSKVGFEIVLSETKSRLFTFIKRIPMHVNVNDYDAFNERRYQNVAKKIFANSKAVTVKENVYLHGFEADLVFVIKTLGATSVVNLEIDGNHFTEPFLFSFV